MLELGAPKAVAEAGGEDECTPRLDNRQCPGKSLDRLIPRRIERIAGTAGDHHIQWLLHRHAHHLLDETHALVPRLEHVAGTDPGNAPLAVDADVDNEVAAGLQGDARVLL